MNHWITNRRKFFTGQWQPDPAGGLRFEVIIRADHFAGANRPFTFAMR